MSELREAARLALEALEWSWGGEPIGSLEKRAIDALRAALAKADEKSLPDCEIPCKDHPDAPHGFDRNSSHTLNRYVCECEHWSPPEQAGEQEKK